MLSPVDRPKSSLLIPRHSKYFILPFFHVSTMCNHLPTFLKGRVDLSFPLNLSLSLSSKPFLSNSKHVANLPTSITLDPNIIPAQMVSHNKPQTGFIITNSWQWTFKTEARGFFFFFFSIYIMNFFSLKVSNDIHRIWGKRQISVTHKTLWLGFCFLTLQPHCRTLPTSHYISNILALTFVSCF